MVEEKIYEVIDNIEQTGEVNSLGDNEGIEKAEVSEVTEVTDKIEEKAVNSAEENETGAILYQTSKDNVLTKTNLTNEFIILVREDDANSFQYFEVKIRFGPIALS